MRGRVLCGRRAELGGRRVMDLESSRSHRSHLLPIPPKLYSIIGDDGPVKII